ncbi:sugar 3,4-ketoisomerase [Adhaeribacter soli]|uniref:WxcM-like domain-containing protein n=1 Tax=Adhaeribacter soli TaxID=2607655 RepID=A0A5N1ILN1_9BACT|nr:FdtA/QdtA family cupin domain-containing protein [Adhaeribacter soli]KAA9327377.1 WxcM-like domain-containing protein [Adhaeribacter soli]
MPEPYLIEFPQSGTPETGFISVVENSKLIPFNIERVFWTYATPESCIRGRHAHYQTQLVLIAISGSITVTTETQEGEKQTFELNNPNTGLFIPKAVWHTMEYSGSALQLVLASEPYRPEDYIRDYEVFRSIK